MKIVAFIMAFLVMALSILPCADKGLAAYDSNMKTSISKPGHEQNDQQDDECSPFCHCTCCAGFSINHFVPALAVIPVSGNKVKAAFLPSDIVEVALPVWQPPRLV